MELLPFNTTGISGEEIQVLEDIFSKLKATFDLSVLNYEYIQSLDFEIFKKYKDATVMGTLLLDSGSIHCYLSFIKVHVTMQLGRGNLDYYSCQAWATVILTKNFGRVFIRKKTFRDKIISLLHKEEVDFNHDKAFASKFYVVSNDEDKTLAAMTTDFRDTLMNIQLDNFILEINQDILLIGSESVLTEETVLDIIHMINALAKV